MKLFMAVLVAAMLASASASRRSMVVSRIQALATQYEVPCAPEHGNLTETVAEIREKNADAVMHLNASCQQRKDFARGNFSAAVQRATETMGAANTKAKEERLKVVAEAQATYDATIANMEEGVSNKTKDVKAAKAVVEADREAWVRAKNTHEDAMEIVENERRAAGEARNATLKTARLNKQTALEDAQTQFASAEGVAKAQQGAAKVQCEAAHNDSHALIANDIKNVEKMEHLVKKLNQCRQKNPTNTQDGAGEEVDTADKELEEAEAAKKEAPQKDVNEEAADTAAPAKQADAAAPAKGDDTAAPAKGGNDAPSKIMFLEVDPCRDHADAVASFVEVHAQSARRLSPVKPDPPKAKKAPEAEAVVGAAAPHRPGTEYTEWVCDEDTACIAQERGAKDSSVVKEGGPEWGDANSMEKCQALAHTKGHHMLEFWAGNFCRSYKAKACKNGEKKMKISKSIQLCRGTRKVEPTPPEPDLKDRTGVTEDLVDMRRSAAEAKKAANAKKIACEAATEAAFATSVAGHQKTRDLFAGDANAKFKEADDKLSAIFTAAMEQAAGKEANATTAFAAVKEAFQSKTDAVTKAQASREAAQKVLADGTVSAGELQNATVAAGTAAMVKAGVNAEVAFNATRREAREAMEGELARITASCTNNRGILQGELDSILKMQDHLKEMVSADMAAKKTATKVQKGLRGEAKDVEIPEVEKSNDASCTVAVKEECGFYGIKQPECESKGCCWDPSPGENSKEPWCHKKGASSKPAMADKKLQKEPKTEAKEKALE